MLPPALPLQLLCSRAAGEVEEEDAGACPAQPLCSRAAALMAR